MLGDVDVDVDVVVRRAIAGDAAFLGEMLVLAALWRPGAARPPAADLLADRAFRRYVEGWPRRGDVGVVGELDGHPVGVAWWRTFDVDDHGYGFVADDVPELSIAVVPDLRGRGVGRLLLEALLGEAAAHGVGRLSLSVEADNPARRLYQRVGFRDFERVGGAWTMVRP